LVNLIFLTADDLILVAAYNLMEEFTTQINVSLISESSIHLFEIDLETNPQNLEN